MAANLTFYGPNNGFFGDAFFPPWGGPVKVDYLSSGPTRIVIEQRKTGVETTFDGTGFTFDGNGDPTGGTITGMTFDKGGARLASYSGIDWDIGALSDALDAFAGGDSTGLENILSSQKLNIDASAALGALRQDASIMDKKVTVIGSDYNDRLVLGSKGDWFNGGFGKDIVSGGAGKDILKGGAGRDKLVGQGGDDKLFGGNHADILLGGFGNDTLFGGKGRDTLDGGRGDDYLVGGQGADTFVFGKKFGFDWIEDFEDGVDMIDLSALGITYDDLTINPVGFVETEIIYGSNLIVLLNVTPAQIDASDFIFA
jgi:Ca2+-binding RTX toxin-like protein